ncbi:hypothetical protein MXB_4341 [Myxobolus squamalis]|nr:hypothetical protein MXB_4341 [Myxobolus squamalis]
MLVHAWVGILISLNQGSVGVEPTKNTHHFLPLGMLYFRGIDSLILNSPLKRVILRLFLSNSKKKRFSSRRTTTFNFNIDFF